MLQSLMADHVLCVILLCVDGTNNMNPRLIVENFGCIAPFFDYLSVVIVGDKYFQSKSASGCVEVDEC